MQNYANAFRCFGKRETCFLIPSIDSSMRQGEVRFYPLFYYWTFSAFQAFLGFGFGDGTLGVTGPEEGGI